MDDHTVNIAICLDQNLIIPATVLLSSIKENSPLDRLTRVFVITSFDPDKMQSSFSDSTSSHLELVFIKVENKFQTLQSNDYITQGTYIRFLLPDLLPDVPKILYLDVDTIVNRNPALLFDQALQGYSLGACADVAMLVGSPQWNDYTITHDGRNFSFKEYIAVVLKMSVARNDDYFNAGVLLMDLEKWRRDGIAEKTVDYLIKHSTLKFMDQDGLNFIIDGNYIRLDTRWNAFASCSAPAQYSARKIFSPPARRWEKARSLWRNDPWIVHYAGPVKPWCDETFSLPLSDIWWDYAMRSPSRDLLISAHEKFLCQSERKVGKNILNALSRDKKA